MRLKSDYQSPLPSYLSYIFLVFLLICTPSTIYCTKEQYIRCRELQRSPMNTNFDNLYSTTTSTPLQGFYNSTCQLCPPSSVETANTTPLHIASTNQTRVVIFVTSFTPSLEKLLIVTSALLSSNTYVTIVTGHYLIDTKLRHILFQHLPCNQHAAASALLDFKNLNFDTRKLPCPVEQSPRKTSLLCNILNAEVQVKDFHDIIGKIPNPSVLVMDSGCIAGMLAAEIWNVPAFVFVENVDPLLRNIIGEPRISSTPWYQYIYDGFIDRFHSFDLAQSFMTFNQVRSQWKLKPIRVIGDMFSVGGAVILLQRYSTNIRTVNVKWKSAVPSDWYYDNIIAEKSNEKWMALPQNLYLIPDLFLPMCVSCLNTPVSTLHKNSLEKTNHKNDNIPVIFLSVGFMNSEAGRTDSRRIMLAFWLARQSIRRLSQFPCTAANASNRYQNTSCWNGPRDFQVIRPGPIPELLPPGMHNLPELEGMLDLPSFFSGEETTFSDMLSRHKPIAMVSICDNDNSYTHSLGPPVLCVDTYWPARKTALKLVQLLRNLYSVQLGELQNESDSLTSLNQTTKLLPHTPTDTNRQDGLVWIIDMISKVSQLREEKRDAWDNKVGDIKEDIRTALQEFANVERQIGEARSENGKSFINYVILYSAWFILFGFILYFPLFTYLKNNKQFSFQDLQRFSLVRNFYSFSSRVIGKKRQQKHSQETFTNQQQQYFTNDPNYQFQYDRLNLSTIVRYLCFRLRDIDLVWKMFVVWVREVLSKRELWDESNLSSSSSRSKPPYCTVTGMNGSHHATMPASVTNSKLEDDGVRVGGGGGNTNHLSNGSIRRRRSVKKRH